MSMRVLVLGADGFIGGHLVGSLAASDWATPIAGGRRARLHEDRPSLRRPRDIERPVDFEIMSLVIKRVHPARIEKDPLGRIAYERVVMPTVP